MHREPPLRLGIQNVARLCEVQSSVKYSFLLRVTHAIARRCTTVAPEMIASTALGRARMGKTL